MRPPVLLTVSVIPDGITDWALWSTTGHHDLAATGADLTASHITTIALGALLFMAGYAAVCWWWPWTACHRCDGTGRFRSPSGKNWRNCPRCQGSGRKQRLGSVLLRRVRHSLNSKHRR